jgi:hypothetical protein
VSAAAWAPTKRSRRSPSSDRSRELLGHSDIRVTRGYTHGSSPLAQDAAGRLGRALFGKLIRQLLRGIMIISALLVSALVRWSRLSESNR